ncbi:uncharacterized protein LOC118489009 [Helianthus annuus]|uniref:uncharacterized protein LOC118489009 n=1 Tax=Helianthus annuus TaxID=4232 RepID=UPI001652CC15|nr:uncharacterized protein LOC118489009 [Helianthus annuus]
MAELNSQKHGRSSKIIRQNQTSLQIFKIHRTKSNIARNYMKMHWVRVEFLQSFQPQIYIKMAQMMMRMVFRIVLLQSCYPQVFMRTRNFMFTTHPMALECGVLMFLLF